MLTEIYIEALLVDEELADQVWELWDAEVTGNEIVAAWQIGLLLISAVTISFSG